MGFIQEGPPKNNKGRRGAKKNNRFVNHQLTVSLSSPKTQHNKVFWYGI